MNSHTTPMSITGVGVGLRHCHFQQILEQKPNIPWLEVHSENFFKPGAVANRYLEEIINYYPLSAHGVGLSLGSSDGIEEKHLQQLKSFVEHFNPVLISEHLSWNAVGSTHINDLLPLPYTEEALDRVVTNIKYVQDYLGRQILVENPSSYLSFNTSSMTEWDFLNHVVEKSSCGLLLDVNNIYVSANNSGFNAQEYLQHISIDPIQEIHLAGFSVSEIEGKDIFIDHHGDRVFDEVWELYRQTITLCGDVPTLIEWDTDIPDLSVLMEEAEKAQNIVSEVTREAA